LAKIQVQGIGVYDDKILKKKIIDMANNLSKLAKKGEWSKSSENGIRALGRMWQAYQDWSRQNESVEINERMKTAFMVHPEDPDKTERHWVKVFNELAKGHPSPIDYGPRESDIYDWNDRSNYKKSIEEYNKYMNRIADKLNKSLDEMNNIYKVWSKIRDKYRKIDKS